MQLSFPTPPERICILRLSAIGDVTHVLPAIHTIRRQWPQAEITWIIGKAEAALLEGFPGVEFIIFDKSEGYRAIRSLFQWLKGRRFDVLLHMQISLRANLASLAVKAPIRIGFDKKRARNLQHLFANHTIADSPNQHVLDSFLEFPKALGIRDTAIEWDIPIPENVRLKVDHLLSGFKRFMVINPCSSARKRNWRNWNPASYAAVIDYAAERYRLTTVLTGGRGAQEREYADAISNLSKTAPLDLVGQTSLKELLEILRRAELVIAPDTGPAHMANTVRTPVIGLYASSNPERTGPYLYRHLTVNRYPEAITREYRKDVNQVPWGTRVRNPDVMELITIEDVIQKVDEIVS